VLKILIVFVADVFVDLFIGKENRDAFCRKWFLIRSGIVECDFYVHMTQIQPVESLNYVQHFRMGMTLWALAGNNEPGFVIETYRIHNESIGLPMSNRMSSPAGFEVLRVSTAVEKNFAMGWGFVFEKRNRRFLNALNPGAGSAVSCGAFPYGAANCHRF
jgi:hypothetical protein